MDISQPPDDMLRAITYRPSRLGVESAWYGHVPFAYWLASVARPQQIVELGTHNGVSYAAFCDAVLDQRLPARCYAVDTWTGDDQAGHYGEQVYNDLRHFNEVRYGAFSCLIRGTFDAALAHIPDGSTDLLHIDGLHTYAAVRHDFESWLPKLSHRAVVLFHDTNVREDDFGVWRFWAEIRARYPAFEFLHGHGLGVLAVGSHAPDVVARLCRTADETTAATRACFAALGERWESAHEASLLRGVIKQTMANTEALRRYHEDDLGFRLEQADRTHSATAATLRAELEQARHSASLSGSILREMIADVRALRRRREALEFIIGDLQDEVRDLHASTSGPLGESRPQEIARLHAEAAGLREHCALQDQAITAWRDRAAHFDQQRRALLASSSWRLTAPLRRVANVAGRPMDAQLQPPLAAPPALDPPPAAPVQSATDATLAEAARSQFDTAVRRAMRLDHARRLQAASATPHIVYISGEADTPGHAYRVRRYADAAVAAGCTSAVIGLADITHQLEQLVRADIVVIWRAPWTAATERLLRILQLNGTRFIYDIDDLMFDPALARTEVIDGIRSMGFDEALTRDFFISVQSLMQHADACTCTTAELAYHIRRFQKPAYVLPNGFDAAALRLSRLAVRRRRAARSDGLLRIGYAGGSRTHQRDFGLAAGGLARLLAERPECRLVLFRSPDGRLPLVDVAEYPALAARAEQIEWRSMVPIEQLPLELARFDINLAPLESGNVFCEAKSELKYFEAALVEVCTVASPTGPLARAIRDGQTGRLAADEDGFYCALRDLLDDPAARARIAHAAYLDVLWQWGPERRIERLAGFIQQLAGGRAAARGFDLDRLRQTAPPPPPPPLADSAVAFLSDQLGEASATVVVPLYNYAHYVEEALASVAAQTEATLDLVIVDDCSTDDSLGVARRWAEAHAGRFNRLVVLTNRQNAGLGRARNNAIDAAETPWVMLLDADNRLRPGCVAACLAAAIASGAAFAYPSIETFGSAIRTLPAQPYQPMRFIGGNYIDAMALVAKSAWAAAGGYAEMPDGWEDYDFWCRCVERGLWGTPVSEVLADYRVHDQSMLRQTTDVDAAKQRLILRMQAQHPWLHIPAPE